MEIHKIEAGLLMRKGSIS